MEEIYGEVGFYKLLYNEKDMLAIKEKEVIICKLEMKYLESLPFVMKI